MQAFVVGPLSDKLGDRRTSNIGLAFAVVGFIAVAFIHSILSALMFMLPFAIGMALARPCLSSLITDATPEDQRGVILGTGSALDNVSGMIMPPVSTGLLGRYGPGATGVPSTIFALVALAMGLYAQRRSNDRMPEATPAAATDSR